MKLFLLLIIIPSLTFTRCPNISRESCQPCPPCAKVPKALIYGGKVRKIQSSMVKEMMQKKKFRHFSTDLNEEDKLMITRDTDEVFNSQTIDLSNLAPTKTLKHLWRKDGQVDEENTTTRRSTIPTATPYIPTKAPRMWMKFTKYMKKRKISKITISPLSTSSTLTTIQPEIITTSETPQNNSTTSPRNGTDEEVPVIPTGYKTNPNFSPDEVPIEDETCNDTELQKILIEGMKIDDSVMSKRSIGAILSSSKRNNISVLCSDQEVAFRLVARKHCQLSAGKATCVLFVL